MKQKLIDALSKLGYPVFLQGSINGNDPYPDTFITFWTNDADDGSHYDDRPANWVWDFDVYVYSNDPNVANTLPDKIREALTAAGFIARGKGWDIPSDEPTHTGWAMEYYYIEPNKEAEYGS